MILDAFEEPMRARRLIRVWYFALLAATASCGSDKGTAPPDDSVHVTIARGDKQTAEVYLKLATPLTVSVTDAAGHGIAQQRVMWSVVSGNGTVSAASSVTDISGYASVEWTLGDVIGDQSVLATVGEVTTPFTATATPPALPSILHYDGSVWTVALRSLSVAPLDLYSISGSSASNVYAVGSQCHEIDLVYDGSAWTEPGHTCAPSLTESNIAWVNSPTDIFIVRHTRIPPAPGSEIRHFDGATWTIPYGTACGPDCSSVLYGMWSGGPNRVLAVGERGLVVSYDGSTWRKQPPPVTTNLRSVWGSGPEAGAPVFAVGDGGTILKFDGTTWQSQVSSTTETLFGVWAASASDVFAVGAKGTILHYDGNVWTPQASGTSAALHGVWGVDGSVFAVGDGGTILRFTGSSWVQQPVAAQIDLRAIWGSAPTNVWAVGIPKRI